MALADNVIARQLLGLKRALRFWFYRRSEPDVIERFHTLYYQAREQGGTWRDTHWLGTPTLKCPLDLWLYQEIIHTIRPDCIIETGTYRGGSGHFLATICDLVDNGKVITVDVEPRSGRPEHPRLTYVSGSSVDEDVVAEVKRLVGDSETVLVMLDSAHEMEHVLKEIAAYGPLVSVGSYLVIEDTHLNGHPIRHDFGPGPMEALDEFLASDDSFEIDPIGKKFMMTFSPRGYLRRVK